VSIEKSRERLLDAIQRVAEKARELSDEAIPNGPGPSETYSVPTYFVDELRESLREWSLRSEQAVRAMVGRSDVECSICGGLPHRGSDCPNQVDDTGRTQADWEALGAGG